MRAWTIFLPLSVLSFAAMAPACSSSNDANDTGRICTPGNFVRCLCKDGNSGTKRCADDGKSFSECECAIEEDTGGVDTSPPEDTGTEDTVTDTGGAADKCPGKTVAVDPIKETILDEDTSTATDDTKGEGACAVAASKEHVWAVVPTGSGKLTVKMTGKGSMDPTLYVRSDCATSSTQMACSETTGAGAAETVNVNVTTGKTYYVFADGKAGSEGGYTLSLKLTTGSFCGDNNVDNGEGCDDGNKVAGDGCENDCRPSGSHASSNLCPGTVAHVWGGKTLSISGSTELASANYSSSSAGGCAGSGGSAPERVYAVTVHKTGTLNAELESDFGAILYARRDSCTTGTEVKCVNDVSVSSPKPWVEKLSMPVTDGSTYWFFVDGQLAYKGTYTLRFNLP